MFAEALMERTELYTSPSTRSLGSSESEIETAGSQYIQGGHAIRQYAVQWVPICSSPLFCPYDTPCNFLPDAGPVSGWSLDYFNLEPSGELLTQLIHSPLHAIQSCHQKFVLQLFNVPNG